MFCCTICKLHWKRTKQRVFFQGFSIYLWEGTRYTLRACFRLGEDYWAMMIYIQELILLDINRSLSLSPSANSVDNWSPSLIDKPSAVCVLNALIHLRVHQLSKINRISNALNMILNQHLFKARAQSEINETGLAAAAFVFQPILLTLTDNGGTWLCRCSHFPKPLEEAGD